MGHSPRRNSGVKQPINMTVTDTDATTTDEAQTTDQIKTYAVEVRTNSLGGNEVGFSARVTDFKDEAEAAEWQAIYDGLRAEIDRNEWQEGVIGVVSVDMQTGEYVYNTFDESLRFDYVSSRDSSHWDDMELKPIEGAAGVRGGVVIDRATNEAKTATYSEPYTGSK